MDFIKQWTICVCITLIIAVILTALTPQGRMKKFYRIIISIFVFVSFLYPFKSFDVDSVYFSNSVDLSAEQNNMNKSYEQMICNKIKSVLEKNNIIGSVINAKVSVDDNEIFVDDVQVAVSDEYDTDMVRQMIFDEVGINARVIHNGE